ncbi:hypothetical protein MKQ68_13135 [Chitinophaga horti]|uniref:Uncharacterized protein n=1 Tax=Chitinophaga horti TaxID=2920382 RepID=A0ABY6IUI7_9BACT|nr:hypothetical protein [Chitinophaga horti]UYQ91038.1 hypothetical protein MKQ68_13135 [Chitinophaga horti]
MTEQNVNNVNKAELQKMCDGYEQILATLQDFEPFSSSQVICNVINEHIKRLTAVISYHNARAEEAEKSMEALADGLRRLRMQAQRIVDETHKHVIRLSKEEVGMMYTGEG